MLLDQCHRSLEVIERPFHVAVPERSLSHVVDCACDQNPVCCCCSPKRKLVLRVSRPERISIWSRKYWQSCHRTRSNCAESPDCSLSSRARCNARARPGSPKLPGPAESATLCHCAPRSPETAEAFPAQPPDTLRRFRPTRNARRPDRRRVSGSRLRAQHSHCADNDGPAVRSIIRRLSGSRAWPSPSSAESISSALSLPSGSRRSCV